MALSLEFAQSSVASLIFTLVNQVPANTPITLQINRLVVGNLGQSQVRRFGMVFVHVFAVSSSVCRLVVIRVFRHMATEAQRVF